MEKTEILEIVEQASICQTQQFNFKPKKRQSMRKRLSGQKSIEDFFKKFSNDTKTLCEKPVDSTTNKQDKMCFEMKKLADLSLNSLHNKVESDPFLKRGLTILAKNVKQNNKQTKKVEELKPNCFDSNKISFKKYRQKIDAKQIQMFQKVIKTLGKDKAYA